MTPLSALPDFKILEQVSPILFSRLVAAVIYSFYLQGGEATRTQCASACGEAFHRRIVPTVALSAHAA
jgi:hypothetical protein